MRLLLIGSQGAGKSTQANLLSEHLGIPFISTGDIFREISKEDSEQGNKIRKTLSEGKLVDDKTVSKIVEETLKKEEFSKGLIIDGYPRTKDQINYFDPRFNKVLYLKLTDEQALKRLLARGRDDDTEELIAKRLKLYHELTDPIITYYQQKGILREIDGSKSIEEVTEDLKKAVNG